MLDRDESILAFNTRVLDWAAREEVPLLERMRYLSIVSSNLDEFFEVRMADLLDAAQNHIHEGDFTERQFLSVSAKARKRAELRSASSCGVMPSAVAVCCILMPCSSVPVRNQVSLPSSRAQRAIASVVIIS